MATAPVAIELPRDEALGTERTDLVTQARALQVTSQATADTAGELIRTVQALRKKIAATFDDPIGQAHKLHKSLLAKKGEHDGPLAQAEKALKDRIGGWAAAEERRRREEAAQAAAEARKRDEEARLAEAQALEAAGENEAAERVLDEPPLPPPVMAAPPKVAGVSLRQVWHVEVTDLGALVRAIAGGQAPASFVEPALSAIRKHAEATGGQAVPGVRAWQAPQVSGRGAF